MNLYQKIVEVRKSISGFSKDSKSFNYSYVSGTQVLSKIKEKMDELGLLCFPSVLSQSHESYNYKDKYNKDKHDFIVHGSMVYRWVNADNPEEVLEIPFEFMGQQDDISKAFGSALTYSERYFLLKFFGVPTDEDDPDHKKNSDKRNEQEKQQATKQTEKKQQDKPQQQTKKAEELPKFEPISEKTISLINVFDEEVASKAGKVPFQPVQLLVKNPNFTYEDLGSLKESEGEWIVKQLEAWIKKLNG